MAGIVGMFCARDITAEDRTAVMSAARGLDYSGDCVVDLWSNAGLCVARVHLPFDRPAAPAVHRRRGAALVLHGRVFDLPSVPGGAGPDADAGHCLALHETEGIRGFARLNGRFNLVLHDSPASSLLLVNDRFASHPLFYRPRPGRLLFASQVRAVLQLMDESPRLDLSSLRQFLVFQTILSEGTFLEGVRTLPPGAVLNCEGGRATVRRYWELRYREDDGVSEAAHAEALAAALRRAIRRGTDGARGTAVLLSGGLDSRALVAVADPVLAVTLGDWENAEVGVARTIAQRRGLAQTFVRRHPDFYTDLVELGTVLGDGAYRFDNAQFARLRGMLPAHVTSLLSGYGFDLLLKGETVPSRRLRLGGWPLNRHALLDIEDTVSRDGLTDIALATMGNCLWGHPATARLVPTGRRQAMVDDIRAVVGDLLDRARDHAPTPAQRCEYARMNMMATRFGAFLNVLSIRHFYRDITVSLDNEILDQHLGIPPRLRLDARVYKRALARLDPGMYRIPDANTGFPPDTHYLVEHLGLRARRLLGRVGVRRQSPPPDPAYTQGSWPSMGELIRRRPSLSTRLAETFADDSAVPGEIFDVPFLKGLLADHLERRVDATWPLLVVATVGTWLRTTLAGRAPRLVEEAARP
jgi:asparagine synthetase B (glutamine-hydrolysing)